LGNRNVEKGFLDALKKRLPDSCRPIIVTDAGYRTPWFRAVEALGWDFVGRVGGHMMMTPHAKKDWIRVETIFETTRLRPCYLGFIDLVRLHPFACHAYW